MARPTPCCVLSWPKRSVCRSATSRCCMENPDAGSSCASRRRHGGPTAIGVSGPALTAARERVGEPDKIGDGERFAARAGSDALAFERGLGGERPERILQRLAPLPKRRGDDAREKRFVIDWRTKRFERRQARDRRLDLGHRPKRAG